MSNVQSSSDDGAVKSQVQTELTDRVLGPVITMGNITQALENKRFRFTCEGDLQQGIAIALQFAGLPYEREVVLSKRDRPDFVVDGRFAIEIKIKGTLAQALRQINRYSEHDQIEAILLVGSPYWLRDVPQTIGGKPVYAMRLTGSLL